MSYTPIGWENLPNTTTPINKTNLNKMDTQIKQNADDIETNTSDIATNVTDISTLNTKVDNLEKGEIYSLNEKVVGEWIDGRPIYRKVINFGNLPNNTTKAVNPGITIGSSECQVVNIYGFATYASNSTVMPLPFASTSGSFAEVSLNIDVNGYISIGTGTDRTGASAYVILEYIKATDIVE